MFPPHVIVIAATFGCALSHLRSGHVDIVFAVVLGITACSAYQLLSVVISLIEHRNPRA